MKSGFSIPDSSLNGPFQFPNTATDPNVTPRDELSDRRLRDDRVAPPLPPLRFSIEEYGSGVRVTILNDGPLGRQNGAIRFDVYWAEDVDATTAAGKAAGFARAVCLAPSIPATDVDHTQSSGTFTDPKYAAGWFYLCGVGPDGGRSAPTEPGQVITGPIDNTVPGDVQHLQISESGKVSNGTVDSELSVAATPPADSSNLGWVQLYLQDYTALGSMQEGYAQKWLGSGGIDFDPLYTIPRRRNGIAATVTAGSPAVVAASGFLAVAQVGDAFELLGRLVNISSVTDTTLTLATAWEGPDDTNADWSIIALVTVYAVSVGKSGSRRDDITNAPSVRVLMDGNISVPNTPPFVYLSNAGVSVLVEWDQVAGSTIYAYKIYRSPGVGVDSGMGVQPPQPAIGTILLDTVPQDHNLPNGSTYARMQYHDSAFTLYDLDVNNQFVWYITTTNTRGDESAAVSAVGTCRRATNGELDPTVIGRNFGKNYLYNAAFAGTAGNAVLGNDTSQDAFMGTDASNLPGRVWIGAAHTSGTGRFRGYTRWEADDGATGAAGSVKHQNGNEVHIIASGSGKAWFLYQEIGAWDESSGNAFKKMGKGEVYTLSVYLSHNGVAVNGSLFIYLEQYFDGAFQVQSLQRVRDTDSSIITTTSGFSIAPSDITATPVRYQGVYQLDAATSTRQVRVNIAWSGSTGTLVVQRAMVNVGEAAALWTSDMGDTNIAIPVAAAPIDPAGDARTERSGFGWVQIAP